MSTYESVRRTYKPDRIKVLLIAESPPPPPDVQSSRQFYYTDRIRQDDRLFVNTIRTLYNETADVPEKVLEAQKEKWLRRLQSNGWYMIEALEESQEHEITKDERQDKIQKAVPNLIERVRQLAAPETKIILIKSNVFEVAAEPLRQAGFNVLNNQLVDYPGRYNQRDYREKLAALIKKAGS